MVHSNYLYLTASDSGNLSRGLLRLHSRKSTTEISLFGAVSIGITNLSFLSYHSQKLHEPYEKLKQVQCIPDQKYE